MNNMPFRKYNKQTALTNGQRCLFVIFVFYLFKCRQRYKPRTLNTKPVTQNPEPFLTILHFC